MNISKIGPSFGCLNNDRNPKEQKTIDFQPDTEFTVTVSGKGIATEGDTHLSYETSPFVTVKGTDATGKEYKQIFEVTGDKSTNTKRFNDIVSDFYAIKAYKPLGDNIPDDIRYWNY